MPQVPHSDGLTRERQIAAVGKQLLDQEGPEGLSMRRLAEVVGVRAPSLYKHVADKAEVVAALQERGLRALAEALAAAPPGLAGLAEDPGDDGHGVLWRGGEGRCKTNPRRSGLFRSA